MTRKTWILIATLMAMTFAAPALAQYNGPTLQKSRWDIGAGRPEHNSGIFLGLRVHFADFGRVYDKQNAAFFPTLGANAGDLDGPLYMFRIGYSGR